MPFLVEADGNVVGFCLIRVRDGGWDVAEFSITPDRHRAGVGRAAVEAVADRARSPGATHLQAKVHPDNLRALPFWLAVGFCEHAEAGVVVTRRDL